MMGPASSEWRCCLQPPPSGIIIPNLPSPNACPVTGGWLSERVALAAIRPTTQEGTSMRDDAAKAARLMKVMDEIINERRARA
jgi:hypothetical protein